MPSLDHIGSWKGWKRGGNRSSRRKVSLEQFKAIRIQGNICLLKPESSALESWMLARRIRNPSHDWNPEFLEFQSTNTWNSESRSVDSKIQDCRPSLRRILGATRGDNGDYQGPRRGWDWGALAPPPPPCPHFFGCQEPMWLLMLEHWMFNWKSLRCWWRTENLPVLMTF